MKDDLATFVTKVIERKGVSDTARHLGISRRWLYEAARGRYVPPSARRALVRLRDCEHEARVTPMERTIRAQVVGLLDAIARRG